MKKLFLCVQGIAVVALALALTGESEGQAKKVAPAPKIVDRIENANTLFNWRHQCYIEGVKVFNPNIANGGPAYLKLVKAYNDRIAGINNLAAQANVRVHFRYRADVGANQLPPLSSTLAYTNAKLNFSDIIYFQQQAIVLPAVGRPVEIDGLYNPVLSGFPGFPAINIAYQGTQFTLYNVTKVK